jgi:hypothetical protein
LKQKYVEALANFAINSNLRRYDEVRWKIIDEILGFFGLLSGAFTPGLTLLHFAA